MYARSQVLARNLASVTGERKKRRARALKTDRTLQLLVAGLVAARTAAGMTQEAVAARMGTSKSVVSRLDSGVCTRPTLSTIENYAVAVGALVRHLVKFEPCVHSRRHSRESGNPAAFNDTGSPLSRGRRQHLDRANTFRYLQVIALVSFDKRRRVPAFAGTTEVLRALHAAGKV